MPHVATSEPKSPPTLEPGDCLTREEFHRRYLAQPGIKAELIDGVVYMPSPARAKHGEYQAAITYWLATYAFRSPGAKIFTEITLRLEGNNEPKPDVVLRQEGGTSAVDEQGYITGPPELVAEVALSSASYDLHQKRALYERAGVGEYLVLDVGGRLIHWWVLQDGLYTPLPSVEGVIESHAFEGLRLDVAALLSLDGQALIEGLV